MTQTYKEVIRERWKRGLLSYKLKPIQKVMYDKMTSFFNKPDTLTYVINSSRRIGKSYTLCVISIEKAIRKPGAEIRFAAPTMKEMKKYILPSFRKILRDCPDDLRPIWKMSEYEWIFPNGSRIDISGANAGHAENLRGPAADLCIVDEAGYVTELDYLLRDILMPQLATTKGKILVSSTPPRRNPKEFKSLCIKAEAEGNYSTYTIEEADHLDKETIELFKRECGGEDSATWKREYLAQFDVDDGIKITPYFKKDHVAEFSRPILHSYMDKYESFDYGRVDAFTALFAYWNPLVGKLFVEDELMLTNEQVTPSNVKAGISRIEKELRYNQVFKRTSDGAHMLDIPGKQFTPVVKGRRDEMVGKLNDWLRDDMIVVHPRCSFLKACLANGEWNKRRDDFARSKELYHVDATAALIYMILGIEMRRNPIPKDLDPNTGKKLEPKAWVPPPFDALGLNKKKSTLPTADRMGYIPLADSPILKG